VRKESAPPVPFKALVGEVDNYVGNTVILAGYVMGTRNLDGGKLIAVLQAPLGASQQPRSKSLSEGQFVVLHKGPLGPGECTKDAKVTVAGVVAGLSNEYGEVCSQPCLKIESREVYVWEGLRKEDYQFWHQYPYYNERF
jgi:starvation-inducible outer membrane lipoprotein